MCDSFIAANPSYQNFFSFDPSSTYNDIFEESVLSVMSHSILAVQHVFKKHKLRLCIEILIDNEGTLQPTPQEAREGHIVGAVLNSNFCYTRDEETVIAEIRLQKYATPELARIAIAHELGHLLLHLSKYCVTIKQYQNEADSLVSQDMNIVKRRAEVERYINTKIWDNAGSIWPSDDTNDSEENLCHQFAYHLCRLHDNFNHSMPALEKLNHFISGFFDYFNACDLSDSTKWHHAMMPNKDRRFYSKRRTTQMNNQNSN